MKLIKRILKWLLYILCIPIVYVLISLLLAAITVNKNDVSPEDTFTVYLNTNGVHLDIIINKNDINPDLLKSLYIQENENYLSFGWGDENFYINTPTWGDLTLKNAFSAMFLKSASLMHLTRYTQIENDWTPVTLNADELHKLNAFIFETFKLDEKGNTIILPGFSYTLTDDFYQAKGSYSCFNTCNSWVNRGFKRSGLKACLWTPFDFGLLNKYN